MEYAPQFTSVGAGGMLFGHWFPPYVLCTVSFEWCVCRAVGPPSYAYTDDSPGLGSLVGREFAQSLGARLLVSVLHSMGSLNLLITL